MKSKHINISTAFHNKTSWDKLDYSLIPYEQWDESWKRIYFKEYPRFKKIFLGKDYKMPEVSLVNSLSRRFSFRDFSNLQIDFNEISKMLTFAAGINIDRKQEGGSRRFYPSAGSRYPIELYLIPNSVQNLERFSYHYNIKRNCLEEMFEFKSYSELLHTFVNQDWVKNSSALICLSASFVRTEVKYGDRGYRYCLLDAGHLAQNILLVSEILGLKCCPIGGFSDVSINKYLELDGVTEAVIYLIAVGK